MNIETNNQNKAVIYCRVSTKEQAEEGNSLVTQERNCREYSKKHDYDIAKVFIEEGESAKTADRTELQKLLKFCSDKKNQIKAVIIYKIDRLSRNTDDYSQLRILLKRYGVEIKSTSEYFENTPAGRFMENIIANVAQFDNDVRTERSVGGMKDAVREGRYVWVAPIGYMNQKIDGKANIVLSDQAWIVKKAFNMMAERKQPIEAILEELNSIGFRTRNGKSVSRSAFYTILNNDLYTGWISKFGERHKGKFEPIIIEELFNRVQYVMRNKRNPKLYRIENPDFPLRRFIKHPEQYKLTGAWSKGRFKKYSYYRFLGTKMYWKKNVLEDRFKEFMDEFAFDTILIRRLKRELLNKFELNSTIKGQNNQALLAQKSRLKEKQSVILQKNLNGIINDNLLREQLAKLDDEIWSIDQILLKDDENRVDISKVLGFLIKYLQNPSTIWDKMPNAIRLKLQWFQFPKGVLFDGKEFRTEKISSVFKLKQIFLDRMSIKVPHPGQKNEHRILSKNSHLQNEKSIAWDEVREELKLLTDVLYPTHKNTLDLLDSLVSSFSSSPEELSPG
jgi:site-specific DNA recombinase